MLQVCISQLYSNYRLDEGRNCGGKGSEWCGLPMQQTPINILNEKIINFVFKILKLVR
jgi:hypothetical protein